MEFKKHPALVGSHAPFSPSQHSWLRYNDEKFLQVYENKKMAEKGTRLHEWAKTTIDLGIKQPNSKKTLYAYVNDAIGYKMSTEVILFYSMYFFGTADAISFRNNTLRIHDLKTGKTQVNIEQLEIYAALFCLEYNVSPENINIELRIYQNDAIVCHNPEPSNIRDIMNIIVNASLLLEKQEAYL